MAHILIGKRTLLAKSCISCGLFKQAREFARVARVYRTSYCYKCKNEMTKPGVRGHQERTLGAAVRHRKPWSDHDIERLEDMAGEGLPAAVIALALNRTVYAVYTMIHKIQKETP